LDAERIRAVAAAIEQEVVPQGDFLGSEEYRRAMAGVLARRALEACLHQEAGEEGGDE
jgi:CO/xanthine dehydrogenase FAD-binding subunit